MNRQDAIEFIKNNSDFEAIVAWDDREELLITKRHRDGDTVITVVLPIGGDNLLEELQRLEQEYDVKCNESKDLNRYEN